MNRSPAYCLVALALLGCGARTPLELADTIDDVGDAGPSPVDAATCPQAANPWLLFDTVGGPDPMIALGIYAMRADGTEGHAVTLPQSPVLYPSVSPDGTRLLYATFFEDADVDGGGDDSALFEYDFATGKARLVVKTSQLTYAAMSPDGKTIAYTTGYSLRAIDADGTHDRALLDGPNEGTGYGHPVFASDSRTIVYGTGGTIGAIADDGSGNTILLEDGNSFLYPNPAFSPDYQRIVAGVSCGDDPSSTLMIYPYASLPTGCANGTTLATVDIASSSNLANDPSWSSTGLIAYASGSDVFVIDESGGTPKNMSAALTGMNVTASDPVWAPGCAAIP